jgi:hypothetical protein
MDNPASPDSVTKDKSASWIRQHRRLTAGIALGVATFSLILVFSALKPEPTLPGIRLGTLGGKKTPSSLVLHCSFAQFFF